MLDAGMQWLQTQGVQVRPPLPFDADPIAHLAGSDMHRARALLDALGEPGVDAIWCGRGGSGAIRTLMALDEIGPQKIAHGPARPLIGLSDATALLIARHKLGARAIHGPVITQLSRLDEASKSTLATWLDRPNQLPTLVGRPGTGVAEGALVAGNLAILSSLCGTPDQPPLQGALLLIEEVAEPAYRVDRMLAQLARSGAFDGLAGLALGTFESCQPSVQACVIDWAQRLALPWCSDLPVGHGNACHTLQLGMTYRLDGVEGVVRPLISR